MEETKSPKENSNDSNASCLLDRTKCFGVVALAVKQIVEDSVVDLKSPEVKMHCCPNFYGCQYVFIYIL